MGGKIKQKIHKKLITSLDWKQNCLSLTLGVGFGGKCACDKRPLVYHYFSLHYIKFCGTNNERSKELAKIVKRIIERIYIEKKLQSIKKSISCIQQNNNIEGGEKFSPNQCKQ